MPMYNLYNGWTENPEVTIARREKADALHEQWERENAEIVPFTEVLTDSELHNVNMELWAQEWQDTYRSLLP